MTTTFDKAQELNLDPAIYGTFAEIGAGQEVARWFFSVGGAAGTVAKSMSSYDMKVSDAIYGKAARYVSRERVEEMLDHEFSLLRERLEESRGASTRFFAFADTAAAKAHAGGNDWHAWMGLRFQDQPGSAPSDVIVHVRMLDPSNSRQQDALGRLGVNLIHACVHYWRDPRQLVESLLDDVGRERLEIDWIGMSGPVFAGVDNRLLTLHLVRLHPRGVVWHRWPAVARLRGDPPSPRPPRARPILSGDTAESRDDRVGVGALRR